MALESPASVGVVRIAEETPVAQTESERLHQRHWNIRITGWMVVGLVTLAISRISDNFLVLFNLESLASLGLEAWLRKGFKKLFVDKASQFGSARTGAAELAQYVLFQVIYDGRELYRDFGMFVMSCDQWLFEGERIAFSNPVSVSTTKVALTAVSFEYPDSKLKVTFNCCSEIGWDRDVVDRMKERLSTIEPDPMDLIYPPVLVKQTPPAHRYQVLACLVAWNGLAFSFVGHSAILVGVLVTLGLAGLGLYLWTERRRRRLAWSTHASLAYEDFLAQLIACPTASGLSTDVDSSSTAQLQMGIE